MPPSIFCPDTTWTGTQILLSEQHCAEGRSFRQVLTQVRLGHALTLLQQGLTPLQTALACGYDSPGRFAARFKEEFGLTPHQYLRTCPSSLSLTATTKVNNY